ncbi:MAG: AEC family transporter [Aquisalinus sp.]|nr:AEC family transporter [Aquisalinus sp.]
MNFLAALLPVIILVGLGQLLARWQIIAADGWRAIDLICYRVLFPALIVVTLARAPFDHAPWHVMGVLFLTQLAMGAIGLLALPLMHVSQKYTRPAVGSIIQSNVRWNTFIALSIAGSLYGEAGLALIAIAAAAMIPTANILSVYAFIYFGETTEGQQPKPIRALAGNPLVIACAIGAALNITGLTPTGPLEEVLDLLAAGSIGLGLLAAGAGINLPALWQSGARTALWSAVRLIFMPFIALALGILMDFDSLQLGCIVIATGVPTAVNGFILSRQLGGDATLSANLIAVQTVFSMMTLPLIFWFIPS